MTIALCVVSYGGSGEIDGLIDSLITQTCSDWRMYIADNSSDLDERRRLERSAKRDSRIEYVDMGANLGYFGAAAEIWENERSDDLDWFVVSNTDLFISDKRALARLADFSAPDAGVVAPSIRSSRSGKDQNPYLRRPFNDRQLLRIRIQSSAAVVIQLAELLSAVRKRLRRNLRENADQASGPSKIYAPHGSFVAFSRRYFEQGGRLTSPTFLFGEEIFVAESARLLGLPIYYEPAISVTHSEHANIGVVRSKQVLRWHRESSRFWWEYLSGRRSYSPV